MIRKYSVAFLLVCFVLTVAIGAFAGNSATITLLTPAQIAGKQLPAGQYKISWSGTGDNVDVKLVSDKTAVTVKAKMVETPQKNNSYARSEKGSAITMFYLAGKNQALVFGE